MSSSNISTEVNPLQLESLIKSILGNYLRKDWVTELCIQDKQIVTAFITAKEPVVVAGTEIATEISRQISNDIAVEKLVENSVSIEKGTPLLKLTGKGRDIIQAGKPILHFLRRMCRVATLTQSFVHKLQHTPVEFLEYSDETSATKVMERSAMLAGGAKIQRLFSTPGVILTRQHLLLSPGISHAISTLLESLAPTVKISIETNSLEEIHEACEAGANMILTENLSLPYLRMAARSLQGRALITVKGHIELDKIAAIAETGINFIASSTPIEDRHRANLDLGIHSS